MGDSTTLHVEFAGEHYVVSPDTVFAIGRTGDLIVDDNPYLHRRFLVLRQVGDLWWLENVGARIAATVSDFSGTVQAVLAPGGRLPLGFDAMHVVFGAGSTIYDLRIRSDRPALRADELDADDSDLHDGETTIGVVSLSPPQRLLLVALSENILRLIDGGRGGIPSSAEASARLGWTLAAFTRRLDYLCQKLERAGASGLRGEKGQLATDRRMRLVEHAVATRLVTRDDLILLQRVPVRSDLQPE
ncbi:MAG: hypothetical protein ABIR17_12455 [Pseudolysinimonas sp.]|uniref:hypothetical protein n=1 Tax=Pseudolysinimonas sp. TaxID=2680009 RepID=UPI003265F52B